MNRSTVTSLINYSLFQTGWFACVLGAAAGWPWTAAGAGLLLALVHLALARRPGQEVRLLAFSLTLGLAVDTFHVQTGVLVFAGGIIHPALPPGWILVLWLLVATTLHYSLSWLNNRYTFGAILGAVSGALAYWAGVRLGAATFGADLVPSLVQIGLSWAVAMPLLLLIATRTAADGKAAGYRLFTKHLNP
ncbi:DUF2878 domain-containing protein [Desulfobulbus alkaliphilus]|uniref:DUF2878 domain-containing protein n=1 Tax=Desulfobulbus alkaliphilus TaxID=869814 RepID=UPI0019645926|nr:DUF2878 domain-containing protein [Desulfobulbus alkaliphilus]MBM9537782.1 DUF2878 domain-containing protein [Desulfobulbus alkaliphilus]